ncbi:MAG TPA: DUF11 domain-containing protein, partial [Gammaproteobacteria bacterium]|nr:DUF11 domain-containing protein [Gammaproteobacteria bacterium]
MNWLRNNRSCCSGYERIWHTVFDACLIFFMKSITRMLLASFAVLPLIPAEAFGAISVTLVGSPDPVRVFEELVQVVTVRNDGAAAVNNVVVELLTPNDTGAAGGDLSAGGVCSGGFCNEGDLATWTVGTLNPGESRVMQMSAQVLNGTADGTVLPLSVTVDYTGGSASA